MNKTRNDRWSLVNKVFLDNFLVSALMELSSVGAGFVDGVVISRMLPAKSMAAYGIAHPIFSLIAVFHGLFSTGMQTVCSQKLGKGDVKEFNRLFLAAFYPAGIMSLFLIAAVMLGTEHIAMILGASGKDADLLINAANYIRGLAFGIPATMLNFVLIPAIQMDSGRKRVLISANTELVINILFDIAAVIMGMGIFGIGLATSMGAYTKLVILLLHFTDRSHMLHFAPLKTDVKEFLNMLSFGTEKAFRRVGNVIRPVFVNKLILFYGSTAAMTAMSVSNSVTNLIEIFAVGLADTVGLLTGIYYGEKNSEAMEAMGRAAHRICYVVCGITGILLIILSQPLAAFYTKNGGDITALTHFALIGAAMQCPLQALLRSRICYLQRIQKTADMQRLILLSSLIYPIVCAFILGRLFGVHGTILCYMASDLLTLTTVWIFHAVRKKHIIPSAEEYLSLPDDFTIKPGDIISLDIQDMEDVSLTAQQIGMFCKGHGIDQRVSIKASVCFEEIAANTVKHGFPMNSTSAPIIDLRVVCSEKRLTIRMQDNCPKYDVGTRVKDLAEAEKEERLSNLGTYVALRLADEIRYIYSFDTNTVFLEFDTDSPSADIAIPADCQ